MRKYIYSILAIAAMMMTFCSCSSDDDSKTDKKDAVVAILKNSNVDYWRQIAKSITAECENTGTVPVITFNNENADVEGQLKNVAELAKLQSEYNIKGIIVAPVFTETDHRVEQAVADFAGKRIPVVVVDTPLDDAVSPLKDIYKAYVGTDNTKAGEQLAAIIGSANASTILIAKVESSVPSSERYLGFCSFMHRQIPTWETDDVDTPENLKAQLQGHPGVSNLVVFNGSLCNSVISATQGVDVYTFDVYESFLKALKNPSTSSIKGIMAQNTFEMGKRSVKALSFTEGDWNIFIPTIYITADNLYSDDVKPFLDYYGIK